MKRLINRDNFKIADDNQLEILLFRDNNVDYFDIYNIYNNAINVVGRFFVDDFNFKIKYDYNSEYFVLYKSTDQNEIIDIISFYSFQDQINIIDKYKNLVTRFNSYGGNLILNEKRKNKKYYQNIFTNRKIKQDIKEFSDINSFRNWLYNYQFKNYILNDDDQMIISKEKKEDKKVIVLENYLNVKGK